MADYDVVIIGAGPAGIFTALELADTGQKVLILEKGHDITTRASQNADRSTPLEERRRNIVCGWGGAGAFSDGKLTLTTEYGGNLDDFMSKAALQKEIDMSMPFTVNTAGRIVKSTAMSTRKRSRS